MLHFYGSDARDVFSDKYKDFEKYKIGCPAYLNSQKLESGVQYDFDDYTEFEFADTNRNEDVARFTERAYDVIHFNFDCDGSVYVRKRDIFEDGALCTYGFFLIKGGVIKEFVTEDYVRGFVACLEKFNENVRNTFADIMKQMGAV